MHRKITVGDKLRSVIVLIVEYIKPDYSIFFKKEKKRGFMWPQNWLGVNKEKLGKVP